ncbi:uncharacterized protein LOC143879015 [Tasmannia lanceolata]|uniref:uncharacterized protein LOC143879015 n=1 Tax=Tasmannia lanceolata TaxID=3420 RepID=UPI004062D29A
MLYLDGSSNSEGSGAGLVITGPDNFIAEYALRLNFKASNNEAEYEALITGIALATELRANRVRVHNDSQLVVSQVNGFSDAKEEWMIKYLEKETSALRSFPNPSVEREEILQLNAEPSWMDPIAQYLKDGVLPSDRKEARCLIAKAAHYIFDGHALYKRSFSWPLLKCLRPSAAELAMREVHKGICGDDSGGNMLAHKILRRGFFWPTLQQDASDFVRK